jgi:hypothetical protein
MDKASEASPTQRDIEASKCQETGDRALLAPAVWTQGMRKWTA